MKKTTLIILLALVLALGAVGLAGCDLDGLSGKVTPGEFETDEQVSCREHFGGRRVRL